MKNTGNSLLEGMERLGLIAARIRQNKGSIPQIEIDIILQELRNLYMEALQLEAEGDNPVAEDPDARAEEVKNQAAEAQRKATAAEKIAAAQALEESYTAEQKAELARAEREQATQKANVIVAQEIEKQRMIVAAEAEAERKRVNAKGEADSVAFRAKGESDAVAIKAKGEADALKTKAEGEGVAAATRARGEAEAIFAKMDAEAKGLFEVLTKQAQGYDKMIQAAGGDATKAYTLLLLEKLPELVRTQVDAIKGIKIDKVTVWDGGQGAGKDGQTSTAGFLSGLMKSVPPLGDLFDQAGMALPEYLGRKNDGVPAPEGENEEKTPSKKK